MFKFKKMTKFTILLGIILLSITACNRKNGRYNLYDKNNKLKAEGYIYEGKYDGPWIYWDNNGKILAYGEYVNGKKDGTWFNWERESKEALSSITNYKNGAVDGNQIICDDKGNKKIEVLVKNNIVIKATRFFNNKEYDDYFWREHGYIVDDSFEEVPTTSILYVKQNGINYGLYIFLFFSLSLNIYLFLKLKKKEK